MSTPVWPSVFANSDDCNSKSASIVDRIPSAGRGQAHPVAMSHNAFYGKRVLTALVREAS